MELRIEIGSRGPGTSRDGSGCLIRQLYRLLMRGAYPMPLSSAALAVAQTAAFSTVRTLGPMINLNTLHVHFLPRMPQRPGQFRRGLVFLH
jgi:hypothetical protein